MPTATLKADGVGASLCPKSGAHRRMRSDDGNLFSTAVDCRVANYLRDRTAANPCSGYWTAAITLSTRPAPARVGPSSMQAVGASPCPITLPGEDLVASRRLPSRRSNERACAAAYCRSVPRQSTWGLPRAGRQLVEINALSLPGDFARRLGGAGRIEDV